MTLSTCCKNIRNNWLTEKIGELAFYERGMKKVARWRHLVELYKLEEEGLDKISKLTEVSVYRKPIEGQSVVTCSRMFCKETYTTIINHPVMRNIDGRERKAAFIKIVVNWCKILNVKNIGVDVRFNNKLQAVVQDPLDERLNTILRFSEMALQMKCGQANCYKQFSQDTAQAIHHTCNGIVRSLFRVLDNFVLLETFSTYPLEK